MVVTGAFFSLVAKSTEKKTGGAAMQKSHSP
jgi:hypothetical protein